MKDIDAQRLIGGRTTLEVIRIGNTVHRPTGDHSMFVHTLLELLEKKGFPYSPCFLGVDEKGWEILTYIEGTVPHGEVKWIDTELIQLTTVLRTFHDATAGEEISGNEGVVCHNDFAPWNMVLINNTFAGIIDFDDAAPGKRVDDFAYFLWTFLELGEDVSAEEQARKIKMLSDVYGLFDGASVIEAILGQQEKILNKRKRLAEISKIQEDRDFSEKRVGKIKSEIEWVKKHRHSLEEVFN